MGRAEDLTGTSAPTRSLITWALIPAPRFGRDADGWGPEVRRPPRAALRGHRKRAGGGAQAPGSAPAAGDQGVNGSHAADFVMSLFPGCAGRPGSAARPPRRPSTTRSGTPSAREGGWLMRGPSPAVDGDSERLQRVGSACRNWMAQFRGWPGMLTEPRIRAPQEGASVRASPRRHGRGTGSPPRLVWPRRGAPTGRSHRPTAPGIRCRRG